MGKKINWDIVGRIIVFIVISSGTFFIVITGVRVTNTTNYCMILGYDYFEIVGEEHFNCCTDTIKNVLYSDSFKYELKTKCVAGGIYPAR